MDASDPHRIVWTLEKASLTSGLACACRGMPQTPWFVSLWLELVTWTFQSSSLRFGKGKWTDPFRALEKEL